MGAAAPVNQWIPEDDLLLKKSVEAGASLEALAKGAVHFSRKFTVRELQDRWYSLLYDPVISEEAAFRMTELERANPNLVVKSGKAGNSKESKTFYGKRRAESVRASYKALRKKIRNEPFNPMDLNFLITPSNSNYAGNENESLPVKGILEDNPSNHFCLEQSHMEILSSAFPDILADGTPGEDGSQSFHAEFPSSFEGRFHVQKENTQNELPHVSENNHAFPGDVASGETKMGLQNKLSEQCQPEKACSNVEENQELNNLLSESAPSVGNFESTSIDLAVYEGGQGDLKTTVTSGDERMKLDMVHHESKAATAGTDCYLAELSNSLFDEEEAFVDEDDKVMIDKSYYDGLSQLLNSPNNCSQCANPAEPQKSVALDECKNSFGACDRNLDDNKVADTGGMNVNSKIEPQPSVSAPVLDPHPEICNGVISCMLNTEDQEIPCNDDVVFSQRPFSVSSLTRRNFMKANSMMSTSGRNNFGTKDKGEQPELPLPKDQRNPKDSQLFPQRLSETSKIGYTSNIPNNDLLIRKTASTSFGLSTVRECTSSHPSTQLGPKENAWKKKISSETPLIDSDVSKTHSPDFNDSKAQHGVLLTAKNEDWKNVPDHTETTMTELDINHMLEPDELLSESEDDVPCYSDIEAMILDMDLSPDDQDGFQLEVTRYQNEETRRRIIRFEQAAHCYMQRAIASRGAFGVLYGRHSKHYIKKPEVLLGRSTEDFTVDVDLGREGRGNKVSRRQAILRLSDDGSFYLKNLGKFSVSINEKEVHPGQSSVLLSNCLLEIRGMPFIFETNEIRVKEYLQDVGNQPGNKKKVEQ